VLTGLESFLQDRRRLTEVLGLANASSSRIQMIHAKSARLGRRLHGGGPAEQRDIFMELIPRIDIRQDGLGISLRAGLLRGEFGEGFAKRIAACDPLRLDIPIRLKRRGVETKLVLTDERLGAATQDPNLIAVVTQGHRWFEEIRTGVVPSVDGLVRRHKVDQGDVGRTLPLAFLAPDIVEAILQGR
jgi:site-specific DNA recombinase